MEARRIYPPLAELSHNVWPNLIPWPMVDGMTTPYRGVDPPMTPTYPHMAQMGSHGLSQGVRILSQKSVPFCPDWESY